MARLAILTGGSRERKWGRIVSIGLLNGQSGPYRLVNYVAAKAGIHGFTKALKPEGAQVGLTANAISRSYANINGDRP